MTGKMQLPLGMTKVPEGWPLMAQAYIDFALWAIGQDGFMDAFMDGTDYQFSPPKCALDRMIDDATGADKAAMGAFLDYLTVNHWGEQK